MQLQIFDVEHGACALLTADNNARFMIDCGHNATSGWKPGSYLFSSKISTLEMFAITNYDEDHASGAADLFDKINVQWLLRNKSVTTKTLKLLKSGTGMGPGIDRLVAEIDAKFSGPPSSNPLPTFSGLTWRAFQLPYPTFDNENNLSLAIFMECNGIGVMFTGDLERAGFDKLLVDPEFRAALQKTRVYVASHHGRESGCSDDVAKLLTNVNYVVISDKGYHHETQETIPFYRAIAKGGPFRDEQKRHVLTTRNDGRIGFNFDVGRWWAY